MRRRSVDRRSRKRPGDRPLLHRRTEKIPGRDDPLERCARERRIAGEIRIDAKFRTPVRRDQESAAYNLCIGRLPVWILGIFRLGRGRLE